MKGKGRKAKTKQNKKTKQNNNKKKKPKTSTKNKQTTTRCMSFISFPPFLPFIFFYIASFLQSFCFLSCQFCLFRGLFLRVFISHSHCTVSSLFFLSSGVARETYYVLRIVRTFPNASSVTTFLQVASGQKPSSLLFFVFF